MSLKSSLINNYTIFRLDYNLDCGEAMALCLPLIADITISGVDGQRHMMSSQRTTYTVADNLPMACHAFMLPDTQDH